MYTDAELCPFSTAEVEGARENHFASSGELGLGQPRAKEKKHPRIRVSDIAPRAKEKKGLRIRFSDIAPGRASETFSARCEFICAYAKSSALLRPNPCGQLSFLTNWFVGLLVLKTRLAALYFAPCG